jgi:hypothetical protein
MTMNVPGFDSSRADALARLGRREERLIVWRSADPDGGQWDPVMPGLVPPAIKHPDVMGRLVGGEIAQVEDDKFWYRAERSADEHVADA